jgi:NAD+ diphosphatase
MKRPYTFTTNPLNRAEIERRDPEWIAERERSSQSRFLPLQNLDVLINDVPTTHLQWVSGSDLAPKDLARPHFLLGLTNDIAHFALDASGDAYVPDLDSCRFEDARTAAMMLSAVEAGILAQARANIDWHSRHIFCGICSKPTESRRGGQQRSCPNCGAEHFPRTDPVVIVVVTNGDCCLLGQSRGRLSQQSMYSALAGFVDQGESIEEAVRREVREEAGIEVGEIRYHSSQPWPFPSSLMIGCHADAITTSIHADTVEMRDVRWFDRAAVRRALSGTDDELRVPERIAIAHHLIHAWASQSR